MLDDGGIALRPGKQIEKSLQNFKVIFDDQKIPYWNGFGGLWGLCKNGGVIPDGDFDLCTFYETNRYEDIVKGFEQCGYTRSKTLINDVTEKPLYAGFNHPHLPHVCLTWWYEYKGLFFYCHDNFKCLSKGAVGPSRPFYKLKAMPTYPLQDKELIIDAEWPGIPQSTKVKVPVHDAIVLGFTYPVTLCVRQRYDPKNYKYEPDKCEPMYNGRAHPPYKLEIKSFKEFENEAEIDRKLTEYHNNYMKNIIKSLKTRKRG